MINLLQENKEIESQRTIAQLVPIYRNFSRHTGKS